MHKLLTINDVMSVLHDSAQKFSHSGKLHKELKPFLITSTIDVKLSYNRRYTSAFGNAFASFTQKKFTIVLNGWMLSSINDWEDTIRHEYAHILHFIALHHNLRSKSKNWVHGSDWKEYAKAVGAEPSFGQKTCGLGVLGKVIIVKSKTQDVYLTYQEYIKHLNAIRKKNAKVMIAQAADMIDTSLIQQLSKIKL